jgi:hypothetical protein
MGLRSACPRACQASPPTLQHTLDGRMLASTAESIQWPSMLDHARRAVSMICCGSGVGSQRELASIAINRGERLLLTPEFGNFKTASEMKRS